MPEWGEWSGCSATCGQGWRERTRDCDEVICNEVTGDLSLETEECFVVEECPGDINPCDYCYLCNETTLETTEPWTTVPTTVETTTAYVAVESTSVDPSCPPKGTLVSWKGARLSKVIFNEGGRVWLRVNFPNNAAYDILQNPYIGFIGLAKRKCGLDLIDALNDGRVSWKIHDFDDYYTEQFRHKRKGGQQTSVILQFYRHTVGDVSLGNHKKDQIYLSLEGLDDVDFGSKDMITCLQTMQTGVMQHPAAVQTFVTDWTHCAAWDKDLGW